MYTYKLLKSPDGQELSTVKRSDGMFIPFDPDNTDYQAFLRWCEEGNQPLPADEPTA
jgi:hypothetical protein